MDLDALYNDDAVEDYEYPWQYLNNRQVNMSIVSLYGYLESRR